jgi:hypothetical protein
MISKMSGKKCRRGWQTEPSPKNKNPAMENLNKTSSDEILVHNNGLFVVVAPILGGRRREIYSSGVEQA